MKCRLEIFASPGLRAGLPSIQAGVLASLARAAKIRGLEVRAHHLQTDIPLTNLQAMSSAEYRKKIRESLQKRLFSGASSVQKASKIVFAVSLSHGPADACLGLLDALIALRDEYELKNVSLVVGGVLLEVENLTPAIKAKCRAAALDCIVTTKRAEDVFLPVLRSILSLPARRLSQDHWPEADFTDYFRDLRRVKPLPPVLLPFEGSRGCRFRCDFCSDWSLAGPYRVRSTRAIVADLRRYEKKYKVSKFIATDLLSDDWLSQLRKAPTKKTELTVCLRVNADFEFWKNCQRCGVRHVLCGIEALSQPLLENMGKQTTVLENVATLKHLAELGLNSLSGVITHHPKSTLSDVKRTAQVLSLIAHLPPVALHKFVLRRGSRLAGSARVNARVGRAWSRLVRDYNKRRHPCELTVKLVSSELCLVTDARQRPVSRYCLDALAYRVIIALKEPRTYQELKGVLKLPEQDMQKIIKELCSKNLLLESADTYLALPVEQPGQSRGAA